MIEGGGTVKNGGEKFGHSFPRLDLNVAFCLKLLVSCRNLRFVRERSDRMRHGKSC